MTPADILLAMDIERRMPAMTHKQRVDALRPVVALLTAGVPKDAEKEFRIIVDALVDRAWVKFAAQGELSEG